MKSNKWERILRACEKRDIKALEKELPAAKEIELPYRYILFDIIPFCGVKEGQDLLLRELKKRQLC